MIDCPYLNIHKFPLHNFNLMLPSLFSSIIYNLPILLPDNLF